MKADRNNRDSLFIASVHISFFRSIEGQTGASAWAYEVPAIEGHWFMAADATARKELPRYPWLGKRGRPFYGWIIVSISSMLQFCSGIVAQGFGVYLGPLHNEFGWSKTVIAAPRSVSQVDGAILGPLNGWLIDRFGSRPNVGIGSFLLGVGLILFGLQHSLWQYFVANIIIDIGTAMTGLLVVSVAINGWFRRKRSIAQAFGLTGYALAGIIGVPLIVFIQVTWGWRASAIASGVFVWLVGVPCALLMRSSPEPYGVLPDGDTPGLEGQATGSTPNSATGLTLREALHTKTFWLLCVSNGLFGMAMSAMLVHRFLYLEQNAALSAGLVALVWTVASIVNVPSRLIGGVLGDRLPKRFVVGVALALMTVAFALLALATSVILAFAFGILYGIGWGVRTPVMNALCGEYFGRRAQGKIQGMLSSLAVPLSVVGPVLVGLMADHFGGYRLAFASMAVAVAIAAIMQFMSPPPIHTVASHHPRSQ